MNQCVVIKLKESSTAENLTRLGALKLKVNVKSSTVIGLEFFSSKTQTIRVNGYDAHFTDESGSSLPVLQECTVDPLNGTILVYISITGGETEIEFSDKYAITRLSTFGGSDFIWDQGGSGVEIGIDVDFEDFKYCTALNSIYLSKGQGTGSLENFKKLSIVNFWLYPNKDDNHFNRLIVEGNISNILKQTSFENILINDQNLVTGDLSAFSTKFVNGTFDLSGTSITGKIDNLSGVSSPSLFLNRMKKYIGGNIGALNNNVKFFSVAESSNVGFEYNGFNGRTNFLAIEGGYVRFGINELIVHSLALDAPSLTDVPEGSIRREINVTAYNLNKLDPTVSDALLKLRTIKKIRVKINNEYVN